MGFTLTAQNSEFGYASGANLNYAVNESRFNGAPNLSTSLQITLQDGDPTPYTFSIGDTYDLSFRDNSGVLHTISNASVTRSDSAGAGGVIVFQGNDQFGAQYNVIWTPQFNLQGWYDNAVSQALVPVFFNVDQNAAYTHSFVCFAGNTRIRTPDGEMRAGQIRAGMLVSTWHGPPRLVLWVGKRRVPAKGHNAPVYFPAGAVGNGTALRLSQQHRVMIRVPANASPSGAPEVLVPAKAFLGRDGVELRPGGDITYVHFLLERHELLIAEGAPCESLLPGPEARAVIGRDGGAEALMTELDPRAFHPARPCLDGAAARRAVKKRTMAENAPLAISI